MQRPVGSWPETVLSSAPSYIPSPNAEEFILATRNGPDIERRVLIIMGNRGSGKCLIKGSRVLTTSGALHPIESAPAGPVVAFDAERLETLDAMATAGESDGVYPCRTLRTASGYELTGNLEHPFLTLDGWKGLGDLRVGDLIATLRECSVEGTERLTDWMPEFAGLMVGDGSCSSATVCASDQKFDGLLSEIAVSLGWNMRYHRRGNGTESGSTTFSIGTADEGPREWIRRLGLEGTTAHTKRVPPAIFTAPNDQVAKFLGAYFACDGTIGRLTGQAEFSSVSRDLLLDVKHLLLRFGVVSFLNLKRGRYQHGPCESWRLIINREFTAIFTERIPVPGEKAERLRSIPKKKHNPNLDVIPVAWHRLRIHGQKWHKNRGVGWCTSVTYGHGREVVRRVALNENNERLLRLADAPIFWDRVTHLEDAGEHEVFNVEVPGPHTFIAEGGVITHNTSAAIAAIVTLALRIREETPRALPLIVAVVRDSWINLDRTTLQTIREFERRGLPMEWLDQGRQAITSDGGTPLVHWHFFGMDRPADADKYQGFTMGVLWLEEVAAAADLSAGIPAAAFGLGIASLRQPHVPKRCLVTMNPPDEDAWILKVEELIDDYELPNFLVKRWDMAPDEKEKHFRHLAARARSEKEREAWSEAADEYDAYLRSSEAALKAIGRSDLATRLVGGEIGEVRVGEPVVPNFVRAVHVVPQLAIIGHGAILRFWDAAGCYGPDTQVLTEFGWSTFERLTGTERLATRTVDGRLEYHAPSRVVKRWHVGLMYRYQTHNVDFLLTPEHTVPVLRESTNWSETSARYTAEELSKLASAHVAVPLRAELNAPSAEAYGPLSWSGDVYARFMGWYLAEGSVQRGVVTVYQSRSNEHLEQALRDTGLEWRRRTHKGELQGWGVWCPRLASYLGALGVAVVKRAPSECWTLGAADTRSLLESFVRGDGMIRKPGRAGWKGGDWIAYTSSEALASDLQGLAMRAGMYARVFPRKARLSLIRDRGGREHWANGGPSWYVSFKTRARSGSLNGKRFEALPYEGWVYCATVPNGTLYVRRNGIAHWNGNSPSTVIAQALGDGGRDGLNILASHTSLNTSMEQHIKEWVLPTMADLGLLPSAPPRRRDGTADPYASSFGAARRRHFEFRDIGDPSMQWEGNTVKRENTSGNVIFELLGGTLEPGPIDWDSRREALSSGFYRSGTGDRMRFIQIDKRYNKTLMAALGGRFRYPRREASGQITMTVEAAKRASGPQYSGVPDALAYGLAVLYPAAEWVRQVVRRPVPPSPRPRSWVGM